MRIACIHQGYELYGSDRCFVESVAAIRHAFPQAEIEVVLPRHGPIAQLLAPNTNRITIEPLWVLRRGALPRLILLGAFQLPLAIARAARRLRDSDLVYVNTSVIVDYQIAARAFPGKAILHVHEIPSGPLKLILPGLARWSGAEIIFNSRATKAAFGALGRARGQVIYNGLAGPASAPTLLPFDGSRPLRVLMLGRVNRIKGQEVLLQALAAMPESSRERLEVRIVGSAFENPQRELALVEKARRLGLMRHVSIEPFAADPSPLYLWADVVAVPSRLPESLGRVAIEAMSYGRPPIVSKIGGLTEVVEDGRTGWHVPAGDADALGARLRWLVETPRAWRDFGAAARARFEATFSEAEASNAIASLVTNKLARLASPTRAAARSLVSAARP